MAVVNVKRPVSVLVPYLQLSLIRLLRFACRKAWSYLPGGLYNPKHNHFLLFLKKSIKITSESFAQSSAFNILQGRLYFT